MVLLTFVIDFGDCAVGILAKTVYRGELTTDAIFLPHKVFLFGLCFGLSDMTDIDDLGFYGLSTRIFSGLRGLCLSGEFRFLLKLRWLLWGWMMPSVVKSLSSYSASSFN